MRVTRDECRLNFRRMHGPDPARSSRNGWLCRDVHLRLENQARRCAHCSTAIRHIRQDDRHGTDAAVVANFDATQYLRIRADLDVIAKNRHGTIDMAVANRDPLAQRTICADLRIGMNKDTAEVPDPQAWTNGGRFRQADTRRSFDHTKGQPVQRRLKLFAGPCGAKVNAASLTIQPDRPNRLFLQEWSPHAVPNQITLPIIHCVPRIIIRIS